MGEAKHLMLIDLRSGLRSSVPRYSHAHARRWFTEPDPLVADLAGLRRGIENWKSNGSHRSFKLLECETETDSGLADLSPLIRYLLLRGQAGEPVAFNHVQRERQGGRRYLWTVGGRPPGVTVGGAKPPEQPRHLLQAIPREVRGAGLHATPGRMLIDADLRSAFTVFLGQVSGDRQLRADIASGDPYGPVADVLGVSRDEAKLVNNVLIGGGLIQGLRHASAKAGLSWSAARSEGYLRQWYARYPAVEKWGQGIHARWARAKSEGKSLQILTPDGRRFSFSGAEVAEARLKNGRVKTFKTVFSSIWRCIEGCVIDHALELLQPAKQRLDLRLVITMFDGVLLSAPADDVDECEHLVKTALLKALKDVGITGGQVKTRSGLYWPV